MRLAELKDADPKKRREAGLGLMYLRNIRAEVPLREALDDLDSGIRKAARKALDHFVWLAFTAAEKEKTVAAYDRFLDQFPVGRRSTLAFDEIEKILFKKAAEKPTVEACEEYLQRFKVHKNAQKVSKLLEDANQKREFNTAEKTVPALQAYIASHLNTHSSIRQQTLNPYCESTHFVLKIKREEMTHGLCF